MKVKDAIIMMLVSIICLFLAVTAAPGQDVGGTPSILKFDSVELKRGAECAFQLTYNNSDGNISMDGPVSLRENEFGWDVHVVVVINHKEAEDEFAERIYVRMIEPTGLVVPEHMDISDGESGSFCLYPDIF